MAYVVNQPIWEGGHGGAGVNNFVRIHALETIIRLNRENVE